MIRTHTKIGVIDQWKSTSKKVTTFALTKMVLLSILNGLINISTKWFFRKTKVSFWMITTNNVFCFWMITDGSSRLYRRTYQGSGRAPTSKVSLQSLLTSGWFHFQQLMRWQISSSRSFSSRRQTTSLNRQKEPFFIKWNNLEDKNMYVKMTSWNIYKFIQYV